jgi:hypothetical protein
VLRTIELESTSSSKFKMMESERSAALLILLMLDAEKGRLLN